MKMIPISRNSFTRLITVTLALVLICAVTNSAFSQSGSKSIAEIAASDGQFSILVSALKKANLAGVLNSNGPFTVFAPTNQAFQELFTQLGIYGINELTVEQLRPILLYHVVKGTVMASDLGTGNVPTLNDKASLKIKVFNTGIEINKNIKVVKADIMASNGVIHVIDKVLVP